MVLVCKLDCEISILEFTGSVWHFSVGDCAGGSDVLGAVDKRLETRGMGFMSTSDTDAKGGSGLGISPCACGEGDFEGDFLGGDFFTSDFDAAGDSRGDLRKGRGDFLAGGSRNGGDGVRAFDLFRTSDL